ncbi:hypothetical protein RJT34_22529 [Clitoria ternatea]|uniref:Uncharacterized protein n=1 Tax=Clitoria ternatea TaxID=43366 RepID=A0AAN9FQC5_CLITE
MMLRSFLGKVQYCLSVLFAPRRSPIHSNNFSEDQVGRAIEVPDDVLEGHFVVLANNGTDEEIKRFIVALHYLNDPPFLRLLERAREEYGFTQKGVLVIPCNPQELEKILEEPREVSEMEEVNRFNTITSYTEESAFRQRKMMVEALHSQLECLKDFFSMLSLVFILVAYATVASLPPRRCYSTKATCDDPLITAVVFGGCPLYIPIGKFQHEIPIRQSNY